MERIEIVTALVAGWMTKPTLDTPPRGEEVVAAMGILADIIIANDKQHLAAQPKELLGE